MGNGCSTITYSCSFWYVDHKHISAGRDIGELIEKLWLVGWLVGCYDRSIAVAVFAPVLQFSDRYSNIIV
jgi:hypothetical protein